MTGTKRNLLISLISAAVLTAAAGSGILKTPDRWVQDTLFQHESVSSSDIIIVGIDEDALADLGPYNTWDRSVMASALERLAEDPDKRPAVVAIDTLYAGTSTPDGDARLARAAAELNVVTATVAEYGTSYVYSEEGMNIDHYSILGYEEPYEALRDVTIQGHINAMEDTDGIMRHALLYVEPSDADGNKEQVFSMAYMAASEFLKTKGEQAQYPDTNVRGQFYVPMSAGPGGFYDGISLSELINGDVPADYYADKIVLIGPYATGLQDAYFTPIDRATQMFGVEFQANVIQSIIENNFKSELSDVPQLIALFAILALSMYLFLDTKMSTSTVCFIVFTVLALAGSFAAYQLGTVIHPLWIPAGLLIIYVSTVIYYYIKAAAARQRVYNTFERYVAPSVVKEILKEGTESLGLGGKLTDIAVLFVDVRGFTTMSERLDPEKIVFILNKILTTTSSCIEKNNGTLDKFVGDATMAFWGAPFPQEDSVYLACRTALDIVNGCEEVSEALKKEIGEGFKVGVGVHYGPAVVGNIGSEKHMDYTAIGDTVNTSARLEANAPGSTVYISRVVADKLGDLAETKSLGSTVKLKGKADGFEVLELLSLREKEAE